MLKSKSRRTPRLSPVVLLIAALALCVGVYTAALVFLIVGIVLGWPGIITLAIILLALGLWALIFIRKHR